MKTVSRPSPLKKLKCAKDKEEIEWVKEQMDLSWFIETRLWYYTCDWSKKNSWLWYYTCDWSRNAEQKKWY